ncbi:MAG TPA: ribonuclease E/G, partial [Vineibacter sp.]|nr:ribonuclease E/G [Vineibacter sp.]
MAKRMLVDATHPEETRVVVVDGTRLEEFDFETATKKQLKGNIYLAKVVRIEPSLQAAFVEYGGNRHGFLAFSEIHPDYYQIPVADREKLLAEQAQRAQREVDDPPARRGVDRSDIEDAREERAQLVAERIEAGAAIATAPAAEVAPSDAGGETRDPAAEPGDPAGATADRPDVAADAAAPEPEPVPPDHANADTRPIAAKAVA